MKNFFVFMASALLVGFGKFSLAQELVVTQKNNQFSEVFLKLENNDKLKIVNLDSVNHKIAFLYKDKEQLVTELKPGASRVIELGSPGLYDIKSQNHPEMMMTIYVPHTIKIDGSNSEYYF